MAFTSVWFFAAGGIALALYLAAQSASWRRLVLLAANLGFAAAYCSSPIEALPLAMFLLLGYGAAAWIDARSSIRRAGAAIALLLGLFVYLKQYELVSFVKPLPFVYSVVGLSYILFRVLHVVFDRHQGALARPPSFIDFINYTCFFPAFASGPIQRFEDFAQSFYGTGPQAERLTSRALVADLSRIVAGLFKIVIVSAAFDGLFAETSSLYLSPARLGEDGPVLVGAYATAAALYTLYLYYNFSGYTDVAVSLGRLFGIALPENFNRPFSARNFIEFWSRWHMSLSEWFKTYLFNPLLKVLVARFPQPSIAPFLAVAAFFVTFLVMGLWHGTSSVFVYYGLFLGCGMSANKLYQVLLGRYFGRKRYQALAANVFYGALCRGMTFAYFAVALTCFWTDSDHLKSLLFALGPLGLTGAFAGMALAAAVIGAGGNYLRAAADQAGSRFASWREHVAVSNAWLAVKILALASLATLFNSGPEFVYQGF